MPDIKIFCENCGFDRFTAPETPAYAQVVSQLVCKKCGYPIEANQVVVFSDITILSQTHSEAFLEARSDSWWIIAYFYRHLPHSRTTVILPAASQFAIGDITLVNTLIVEKEAEASLIAPLEKKGITIIRAWEGIDNMGDASSALGKWREKVRSDGIGNLFDDSILCRLLRRNIVHFKLCAYACIYLAEWSWIALITNWYNSIIYYYMWSVVWVTTVDKEL